MKRPGRRPLPKGQAKHGRLFVLLNAEERQTLDAAAEIEGQPTSTWVRDTMLKTARSVINRRQSRPAKKKRESSRRG